MNHPTEDLFASQAQEYARFRPTYDEGLFRYLAELSPGTDLAWDCATGSGQSAVMLAKYFRQVIATDISEAQLRYAIPHPRVRYEHAPAERTDFAPRSVDLITVATALHWLNLQEFFAEADRVLKHDGLLACWSYFHPVMEKPLFDVLEHLVDDVLGPYWDPRVRLLRDGYQGIAFPFEAVDAPLCYARGRWTRDTFYGFLRSWSATQTYIRQQGEDPLQLIQQDIEAVWPDPQVEKEIRWPLHLHLRRKP